MTVFLAGDHVYVTTSSGVERVARIDRMWRDAEGDAHFHGPYYLQPRDVEHEPIRTFYVSQNNSMIHFYTQPSMFLQEKEMIKSSNEETFNMASVTGRCAVMPPRDYVACRFTEVAEPLRS